MQVMMRDLVGIVRNQAEMERALEGIVRLEHSAERVRVDGNRAFNPAWHTALDLRNLLTVSEAITRSALERKESRGAHFREDHPGKDPASGKVNVIVVKSKSGEMTVRREPIPEMPAGLKQ